MDQPTAPLPDEPTAPEPAAQEPRGITVDELLAHITPRAWVTPTLAVLILIGFGIELALGVSAVSPTAEQLLKAGGEFGPSFAAGEWWRAFTSMFLHAGPLHLAFNLWAFLSVGILTERVFGNRSFLAIYVMSGVGGSLASLVWSPMTVGVGASGAIFGVYGALLAFVVMHRGVFPTEYLAQQRNSIIGFIGYNVVFGLSQKNTDMAAHAGGLVTGALAGAVLARDVLRPAEHAARRTWGAAGLAVLLMLAAFGARARLSNVPLIKATGDAEAAHAHFLAKQYPQAVERYTQALAQDRDQAWLFNRGLAYLATDDLKRGQQDIRDAHALKPTVKTHTLLCDIGVQLGGTPEILEEAIKHCSAGIPLEESPPSKARLYAIRAIARDLQKRPDESLADAETALAIDEHSVLARSHRAGINLERGKVAEAEQDCVRLVAEAEPRPFDLALCARVAHERRDPVAQRAHLDRCLAIAPTYRNGLLGRAWLNGQEGRLAESVKDYGTLVVADPELAVAWNNRAWVEVELGEFAAARADADRAVALAPDSAPNRGTRCFALAGLGEHTAARIDCARALELEPDNMFDRGMLAFLDKRYADARRDWIGVSQGNPVRARELRPWLSRLPGAPALRIVQ